MTDQDSGSNGMGVGMIVGILVVIVVVVMLVMLLPQLRGGAEQNDAPSAIVPDTIDVNVNNVPEPAQP